MITKTLFAFVMAFALGGCSSYLDNNFFHTRISVKMADARSGEVITVPATIRFTGDNGSDIVTFSGDKHTQITTSQGQIEVTIDPNVAISSGSPFQFAVHVEADGYVPLSKGFQFQTEGKKTIEIKLAKISDEEESTALMTAALPFRA